MGLLSDFFQNLGNPAGYVGKKGENYTAAALSFTNFFGHKGITLRNVYLPTKNGKTTEIDLLYITKKGIFVLESKNYSGYIFGNEKNRNWTATLYAGKTIFEPNVKKFHFFNPVWQNKGHIDALKNILNKPDIRYYSMIVFSDRCKLKEITITSPDTYAVHRYDLRRHITTVWKWDADCLSEEEMNDIFVKLLPFTNKTEAEKYVHVQQIKEKLSSDNCPHCGKPLVLRTAKKGANAGNQFYGCSGYPSCRYTISKEEHERNCL